MSLYIKGMSAISPQQSWNDEALMIQSFDYRGVMLKCVEPDYDQWIDPRQSRRMSRVIKMGITAALMALRDARTNVPDAIITGTGYGCLDDTGVFLTKLVENNEQALNPTPFIQSTHNTIGSTIAMLLQCQGYNQTYAHGPFSFENALLDALMLDDKEHNDILVGGVDEITEISHKILSRFGIFRRKLASTLNLFRQLKPGTINGEGAAFFVVSNRQENGLASVEAVRMFYKPTHEKLKDGIEVFIRERGLLPGEVDFVLLGNSGNRKTDQPVTEMCKSVFQKSSIGLFKHLCGDYPTASSFALWLATRIIAERHIPEVVVDKQSSRSVGNVLILNSWFGTHYSLILVKACRSII
jgi:3-oxoacyl-[acyl-carrier-protein] synthase II